MALSYFPYFDTQFTDANGLPLSGGKVYSYYDGTSTPAVTYNQNGVANPNPIILDAAGRCDMLGDDTITYKIVVYTSSNALVKTWIGVALPSGNGGTGTLTMDTIAQGTNYRKMTTSNVNSLTTGGNTTLHYHSADRQWANITGKPSTFAPSVHASTHKVGGSDPLSHNDLGPQGVGSGITYGHISDSSQDISGEKHFTANTLLLTGDDTTATRFFIVNGPVGASSTSKCTASENSSESGTTFVNNYTLLRSAGTSSLVKIHADTYGDIDMSSSDQGSIIKLVGGQEYNGSEHGYEFHIGAVTDGASFYLSPAIGSLAQNFNANVFGLVDGQYGLARLGVLLDSKGIFLRINDGVDPHIEDSEYGTRYFLPEHTSSNYNIATREWVTTGYAYNHIQSMGSMVWTINHGKPYYPVIQCVDSSGSVINGSIQHFSGYSTVTFTYALGGTARAV